MLVFPSFPTLASISRYFLFHSQSYQFPGSFIILTHLVSELEQDDVPCTHFLNILLDYYIRKFTKFQIHSIQFIECYLTFIVRFISYPTSLLFQIFFSLFNVSQQIITSFFFITS